MKSVILPGENIEAYCERCERFQPATYDYGSIELGEVSVPNVMRAACDRCGEVVEIAQQSAHRLRQARPGPKSAEFIKKNIRVSRPLKDYADNLVVLAGLNSRAALEIVVRAMLRVMRKRDQQQQIIKTLRTLNDPILKLKQEIPATLMISPRAAQELESLRQALGTTESEVIRRLLVASESEPHLDQEIRALAEAIAD